MTDETAEARAGAAEPRAKPGWWGRGRCGLGLSHHRRPALGAPGSPGQPGLTRFTARVAMPSTAAPPTPRTRRALARRKSTAPPSTSPSRRLPRFWENSAMVSVPVREPGCRDCSVRGPAWQQGRCSGCHHAGITEASPQGAFLRISEEKGATCRVSWEEIGSCKQPPPPDRGAHGERPQGPRQVRGRGRSPPSHPPGPLTSQKTMRWILSTPPPFYKEMGCWPTQRALGTQTHNSKTSGLLPTPMARS